MLLKPHGSGFEFFIAYYLCVTVILLQTPRSRLMGRKKKNKAIESFVRFSAYSAE